MSSNQDIGTSVQFEEAPKEKRKTLEQVMAEQLRDPIVKKGMPPPNPITAQDQKIWRLRVFAKWFVRVLSLTAVSILAIVWGIDSLPTPEYGSAIFFTAGFVLLIITRIRRGTSRSIYTTFYGYWLVFLSIVAYVGIWAGFPIEAVAVFAGAIALFLSYLVARWFSRSAFTLTERERWGILRSGVWFGVVGPGRIELRPFVDSVRGYLKVERVRSVNVPINKGIMKPSEDEEGVVTKGMVTVSLNATPKWWIKDTPESIRQAILNVDNLDAEVVNMSETSTTEWMSANSTSALPTEETKKTEEGVTLPPKRATELQDILTRKVSNWGVEVDPVGLSDIELPPEIVAAYAKADIARVLKASAEIMAAAEKKILKANYEAVKEALPEMPDEWYAEKAVELRKIQGFGGESGPGGVQFVDVSKLAGVGESSIPTSGPG